jgi:hydroxymethylglutaryl-CoA reductase (NADPH)
MDEHVDEIRDAAQATTRAGKLQDIERYTAGRMVYTRLNYTTGDVAGQNLTDKATAAACAWIHANHAPIERFYLESNFATDKKSSQVNMLNTRGKRVVAEATIPNELFRTIMRSDTERMRGAVAGLGHRRRGVGRRPRPLRAQPALARSATGRDLSQSLQRVGGGAPRCSGVDDQSLPRQRRDLEGFVLQLEPAHARVVEHLHA